MSSDAAVIVGGGPAGLACGIALLRNDPSRCVSIVEKERHPGGIAGGFRREGLFFDYGSHRIHPSASGRVLALLEGLPGLVLRRRRRNGRILIRGRLLKFPPSPADALLRLPPGLSAGIAADQIRGLLGQGHGGRSGIATFADALESGMGATMAREFYIPYARKLWGLPADGISAGLASRRVPSARPGGLLAKALGGLPLISRLDPARYFRYPEGGFGSLAGALAREFESLGGELLTGSRAVSVSPAPGAGATVSTAEGRSLPARFVVWAAPLDTLAGALSPSIPDSVRESAGGLGYRAMTLLYVTIEDGPYTGYDAHYFPDGPFAFSRMSEPRNYPAPAGPGRTGLCLELPCATGDDSWRAGPDELLAEVQRGLASTPLPVPAVAGDSWVERITHAYPVYRAGYEKDLEVFSDWISSLGCIIPVGRQGLFAHDNLHHAMETGLSAADRLSGPGFDREGWLRDLARFRSHCVSD